MYNTSQLKSALKKYIFVKIIFVIYKTNFSLSMRLKKKTV